MKILLDTCTFFWIITDDPKLSSQAKKLFIDPSNEVYLTNPDKPERIATKAPRHKH